MTAKEREMLDGLIERIQETHLQGKDPEAQQRIEDALRSNPDALYILCQTVLVQGYALEQAQRQLQTLRQQHIEPEHSSFLEKIFGSKREAPTPAESQIEPARHQQPSAQPSYGQPAYTGPLYSVGPLQNGYTSSYGQGLGGGGFLQGALQTAAGVAMGEIAFQGIENLLHGLGHYAGYESDRDLVGLADESRRCFSDGVSSVDDDSFSNRLAEADHEGSGLSSDIEDRRGEHGFFGVGPGEASGFADTNNSISEVDDGFDIGSDDGSFDDAEDFGGNGDSF